ncbi:MAG TPA: type I pantothenate kinase [Vicinamibacterales bacterium]
MRLDFDRAAWARLGAETPLTLAEAELVQLQGLNEPVSLGDVSAIYVPVSHLLRLIFNEAGQIDRAVRAFLASEPAGAGPVARAASPLVVGVAGSVAVGKSTFARVLRALVARWPGSPRVDLVTTDGFLFPNDTLEARGLLGRKGFPESYDVRRLIQFLTDVKRGGRPVRVPVYSHQAYDILPGEVQTVDRPDVVIIEGLNVLQAGAERPGRVPVSAFFDFSIYIDADERDIEEWYIARFLALREIVFQDPQSYFHRYARLSDHEARETARDLWTTINGVNLRENIGPTRDHAWLILEKGPDHAVRRVRLKTGT